MRGRMLGAGWASGDHPNPDNDEGDAGPALRANVLMQPEDGKQDQDDIANGGSGHHVGEIGKGERNHVARHEGEEENDSEYDKRIGHGGENFSDVLNVDGVGVLHAAREEGVADRTEEDDG